MAYRQTASPTQSCETCGKDGLTVTFSRSIQPHSNVYECRVCSDRVQPQASNLRFVIAPNHKVGWRG